FRTTEVRLSFRIRFDGDFQSLEFSAAHVWESLPIRPRRGSFIEVDRHLELVRDPPPDGPGERDAIIHRDPADGNEREDVEGSDPRVLPAVVVHVDSGDGGPGPLEGRFGHRVAAPDERDDAPIVIRVHLRIEKANTGDGRDRFRDGIHDLFASPLRKVRDALYDVCHSILRGSAEGPNSLKSFSGPTRLFGPFFFQAEDGI